MTHPGLWLILYWLMIMGVVCLELLDRSGAEVAHRKKRWPVNFALMAVNALVMASIPLSVVIAAEFAADRHWGLMNNVDIGLAAIVVMTVVSRSLADWGLHYVSHKVPLLWRLHRVHHSDGHLDATSALRTHPLEMMVGLSVSVALAIILGWHPLALIAYEFGVVTVSLLTHSSIKLPPAAERVLGFLFITPILHHLHHSDDVRETDTNFGAVFSVWDRLFGTFLGKSVRSSEAFGYGLDDVKDEQRNDLHAVMMLPFRTGSQRS
jgi:sterol desaturase/sphingolipid hydroxylase (fatty acid hydroxylase superfamily)